MSAFDFVELFKRYGYFEDHWGVGNDNKKKEVIFFVSRRPPEGLKAELKKICPEGWTIRFDEMGEPHEPR